MTFTGKISHGAIILPPEIKLPEGLEVEVTLPESVHHAGSAGTQLLKFAGIVNDLPADFARNHNHYIHGASKR